MTEHVSTPDGRQLEILVSGPEDGYPFVFHGGTPSAAVRLPSLDRLLGDAALRMVTWSRPGYGSSTPRAEPDRPGRIADDVVDTVTVLDELGLGDFVTLGWSGGGPRALGCAALLPERCRAAVSLAGVAPYGPPDLDFVAGMGPENVRDFEAAVLGRSALEPLIEAEIDELKDVTGADIVAAFGGLVDGADAAALTGEFGDFIATSFRRACEQGVIGLLDDNLMIVAPWGFDVDAIRVPVSVWQGRQDKMVPFAHGRWLADHIPGARRHLFEDEGHISLVSRMDEMLEELRDLAGLGAPH